MIQLTTVADVISFLDNTGVIYEKGSIRPKKITRSKELFWQFRGIFRNYIITEDGDLVSAI